MMVLDKKANTKSETMPAIIKLQFFLETLAQAIYSLDLEEQCQLQEIIDQQIF